MILTRWAAPHGNVLSPPWFGMTATAEPAQKALYDDLT